MTLPQTDVLIVTWTSGEARTLGTLLAQQPLEKWTPYRRNVADFIPKVTGPQAPFNDRSPENARYYQTLGLYCLFTIGHIRCMAFKSGLHPAYDGPKTPILDLWKQILGEVEPKIVITTGTGGGIGSDVQLGDVVVASHVRFDLTGPLKDKPYAKASYGCSTLKEGAMRKLVTPALLLPNGDKLPSPRTPILFYPSAPKSAIVTTDTFAFDDSTNHFKLQGLGKCCDMGDAFLGLAMSAWAPAKGAPKDSPAPAWVAIRNASDPQIANPAGDLTAAKADAEKIYSAYQDVTTAGSLVATWATVVATLGGV